MWLTQKNSNISVLVITIFINVFRVALFAPCRGKKFAKKIYIFSDLGSPFGDDQMDVIINGLKEMEIHLTLM